MKDLEWIALAMLKWLGQGRKVVTRPLVCDQVCEYSRAEVKGMFTDVFPACLDKPSSARPERVRSPRHPIWNEEQAKGKEADS